MAKQDYLMNRKILFQLDYIKQVCLVLTLEATPSAIQYFKRFHKISHPPGT